MYSQQMRYFAATRYFSKNHEWIDFDASTKEATVGITDHAQDQLGEIVFIEIKEAGETFSEGDSIVITYHLTPTRLPSRV